MIWSKKKAFTLVELLVVIVIIWILAAIWFMNYGWYAGSAKDTARVKDLKTISEALELTLSKWVDLPQPDPLGKDNLWQDSFISESYDGINFKTGLFWDQKRLEFKWDLASLPIDPNGTKYRYSVSDDGRYYVLTATMEDWKEYKYSNFMDSTGLLASNKPNPSWNNSNWWSNNGWQNWWNPWWSWNPLNPGWSQWWGGQQQWPDDTPPQFLVSDGTIINVSFWVSPSLSQIQATDNSWKVTVDYTPKTINSNKTWDNPVRYTATDPAGNSTSITVIYRVWRKFTTPYFVDSSWNRLSSWMKKELNKWQSPNHWDIKARDEIDWELQVTRRNDVNVNVPWTYVITYVATNNWWQESNLNVQYVVKWPSWGWAWWAWSSISITEWENLNYVELWNKIVITWFKPWKETENLIIPEMIKWKRVTDINANSFKQLNKIKTVIAPSIEKIWDNAFQWNPIQSIDMWSVKTIWDNAFFNNQLTSITLPNVTNIWSWAFFNNNQLTSITLPNVTNIWDNAFKNNQLTSITLPNVTNIWTDAFSSNQLTSITLPNVTNIWDYTFKNNQLTSITLPNVTNIWDYAFQNNKLTSITLSNVTNIWDYAFQNNLFTEVTLPEKLKRLDYNAFAWNWIIKVENKSTLTEEQIKWAFNWNNVLEYNWQCRNSWCN